MDFMFFKRLFIKNNYSPRCLPNIQKPKFNNYDIFNWSNCLSKRQNLSLKLYENIPIVNVYPLLLEPKISNLIIYMSYIDSSIIIIYLSSKLFITHD